MKLSKAQTELMNKLNTKIEFAKSVSYAEWIMKEWDAFRKEYRQELIDNKTYEKDYLNIINENIVKVHCNAKTLKKLEEYGLVKIVYDSTGEWFGLDKVKVLG